MPTRPNLALLSTTVALTIACLGSIVSLAAPSASGSESAGAQDRASSSPPSSSPTRSGNRQGSTTAPSRSEASPTAAADAVNPIFVPPSRRVSSSLVTVTIGDLPIIISAPHGGTSSVPGVPTRTDTSVPQFETVTDSNTDDVADRVISRITQLLGSKPYGVVARFDREYIDANRQAPYAYEVQSANIHYWAYHQALQRACDEVTRKFGRGILIDLHGQGSNAGVIYRGTRTGETVRHILTDFGRDGLLGPNSIIGQLQAKGYSFLPNPTASGIGNETTLNGGWIVFAYGATSQAHIDAIQFEMGSNYRSSTALNTTGDDIAAAVVQFIRAYHYLPDNDQRGDTRQ